MAIIAASKIPTDGLDADAPFPLSVPGWVIVPPLPSESPPVGGFGTTGSTGVLLVDEELTPLLLPLPVEDERRMIGGLADELRSGSGSVSGAVEEISKPPDAGVVEDGATGAGVPVDEDTAGNDGDVDDCTGGTADEDGSTGGVAVDDGITGVVAVDDGCAGVVAVDDGGGGGKDDDDSTTGGVAELDGAAAVDDMIGFIFAVLDSIGAAPPLDDGTSSSGTRQVFVHV